MNLAMLISFHCRYRPAAESDETIATSPKKTKPETKTGKSGGRRKTDELWTGKIQ